MSAAGVEYAREVYAASATIGYDGEDARSLKAMLDEVDRNGDQPSSAGLVALAQKVQFSSIGWAQRQAKQ